MKRVFVMNVPVYAYIDAWVEVPEDTDPELLNEALAMAICDGQFRAAPPSLAEVEVDEGLIQNGWEFMTPLEKS